MKSEMQILRLYLGENIMCIWHRKLVYQGFANQFDLIANRDNYFFYWKINFNEYIQNRLNIFLIEKTVNEMNEIA